MSKRWIGLLVLAAAVAPPLSAQSIGPTPGPGERRNTTTNPLGKDRRVVGEGRRLFNWYNCSGCHGDHAGGGMGPSLRDSSWIYGNADAQIYASISDGRTKGMPAWGERVSAEQIWKLVAYIKSLRTSGEPDRPDQAKP